LADATICIALVIWAVFLTDLMRRRVEGLLSADSVEQRALPRAEEVGELVLEVLHLLDRHVVEEVVLHGP
jgi:hypothetical protein